MDDTEHNADQELERITSFEIDFETYKEIEETPINYTEWHHSENLPSAKQDVSKHNLYINEDNVFKCLNCSFFCDTLAPMKIHQVQRHLNQNANNLQQGDANALIKQDKQSGYYICNYRIDSGSICGYWGPNRSTVVQHLKNSHKVALQ